jgi:hypothetical protein
MTALVRFFALQSTVQRLQARRALFVNAAGYEQSLLSISSEVVRVLSNRAYRGTYLKIVTY